MTRVIVAGQGLVASTDAPVGATMPSEILRGAIRDPLDVETDILVMDLRGGAWRPEQVRALRVEWARAFILGLVHAHLPVQTKWSLTQAGCDDFLVVAPDAHQSRDDVRAILGESHEGALHVLAVDDDANNRDLIEQELMDANLEVELASDGVGALAAVRARRPDIVLLDIMMPDLDGREVCRRLKSDAATASVPVVMVSALGQIGDKLEALDMGANDYVTKPYDRDILVAKIRSLVWQRRAQAALDRLTR